LSPILQNRSISGFSAVKNLTLHETLNESSVDKIGDKKEEALPIVKTLFKVADLS